MPDTDSTPAEIWRRVVAELVNRPDGAGSPVTKIQEAYLRQVNPVAIVKGYAVLSVPSHSAKDAIENDLSQAISGILTSLVGVPCSLAVSVNRDQQPPQQQPDQQLNQQQHSQQQQPQQHQQQPDQQQSQQLPPIKPVGSNDHSPQHNLPNPPQQPGTQHPPQQGTDPSGGSWAGHTDFPSNHSGHQPHLLDPAHDQSTGHDHTPSATPVPANDQPATVMPPQQAIHGTGTTDDRDGNYDTSARATDRNTPGWAADTVDDHPQPPAHHPATHRPPRLPREARAVDPDRDSSISARYTFDNFVTGPSNRFAQAAAIAVAEAPARAFNPLFIWGGSGLGKTHLLHATGTYARQLDTSLRVKYVSSEEFTNDYINSVRDDRQESFKRRYRNLDVLMVDDIQFLAGKEGTQEEFFHTFNALHQANKQIILSSDRPPKQLTTLHDRLRTRFQAGLIADIQPPDVETRIAILMRKAETDQIKVERDVLELIATNFESSIRELEGALIRVAASASLNREPVNLETARTTLQDILPEEADVQITSQTIIEVAAEFFDMSVDVIIGTGKARARAHARQLAMYLCRELTDLSLPKIGQAFGGRDHTTVMYAEKKIKQEIKENRETYNQIQELTQLIKTRARA